MKTRLSKVLACLFAGILTATAADWSVFAEPTSILEYLEYYVCPNSKILKEDETDYSECQKDGILRFSAAANERESAQIILTKEGEYKDFKLELEGDLSDVKGNSIPKENFEIYFEHYVKAEHFWALDGSHTENGKVSWDIYPDALIPEELAREVGANTFKLDGDKKNQGLWFTVTVPPKTPAGIYRSRLTGSLEVDVEVKVYDFELPTVTNSRTFFNADTGNLPSDGNHLVNYLQGIVGMSSTDIDDAKRKYCSTIDQFLNDRKVSSGYKYSLFSDPEKLSEDVDLLTGYVKNDATRAPYYNLCASYFDYGSMKDNEFQPFKCPARIIRYNGNIKKNNEPDVPAIGIEDLLKEIVNRCIDKKFDYLQFAFLYLGRDDESPFDSEAANIRTLVNSYIFEEIKKTVEKDIKNAKNIDSKFKDQLVSSLKQIPFIHTVTPTENSGNWSDILYQGLEIKGYGKDGKKNYSEDYKDCFPDGDKNRFTITIPNDFTLRSYCPLFNDFSSNTYVKNTEASQLSKNLAEYQKSTDFWWYSCNQSGEDACIPGYMINCNRGAHLRYKNDLNPDTLSMNPLAVSRGNKWQQFNLGILGEIYWAVDVFYFIYEADYQGKHDIYSIPREVCYPYDPNDTELIRDPENLHKYLKTDIGITATNGDNYTASDGMLIYPVKQLLKNVYGITDESTLDSMSAEYGYFCSSIRLENIAEANDDYDYLCLAKQKHPECREQLNNTIKLLIEPGNVDYTNPELTNSSNLEQARAQLAALIEGKTQNETEVTPGTYYSFLLSTYGVQDVPNWKNSNMTLCFDVFETNTYQNETRDRTTTFRLGDGKNGLSNLMKIDFAQKKILSIPNGTEYKGSSLIPKGYGWYQVMLPLSIAPANEDVDPNGTGILRSVDFGLYIKQSFIVDNFKVVKEITNDSTNSNNSMLLPTDVYIWTNSNKVLCFDVYETDKQVSQQDRTAVFNLVDNKHGKEWKSVSNLIKINFSDKTVKRWDGAVIPGASLNSKGDGWYQVFLPLSTIPTLENVCREHPISIINFNYNYVNRSFLVDNFRIINEITNDSTNSNNSVLLSNPVDNWSNSGKVLRFNVYETDKQVSQQDRTAVFNLVDNKHGKEWKSVSSLIKINFADIAVTRWDGAEIAGASLIYMGNGWYQVILPLSTIPTLENVCKEHPISIINFNYNYVNRSFLVDFNVDNSLEGKGDLDRNGLLDPSDASMLSKNLSGNEISSLRSGKVADLDQNGVINAVDLTHLKSMMLSQ